MDFLQLLNTLLRAAEGGACKGCVCVCVFVCVCVRERERACVRGGALWKFVRRNYQCSTARQLWGQKEDRLASEYK